MMLASELAFDGVFRMPRPQYGVGEQITYVPSRNLIKGISSRVDYAFVQAGSHRLNRRLLAELLPGDFGRGHVIHGGIRAGTSMSGRFRNSFRVD